MVWHSVLQYYLLYICIEPLFNQEVSLRSEDLFPKRDLSTGLDVSNVTSHPSIPYA